MRVRQSDTTRVKRAFETTRYPVEWDLNQQWAPLCARCKCVNVNAKYSAECAEWCLKSVSIAVSTSQPTSEADFTRSRARAECSSQTCGFHSHSSTPVTHCILIAAHFKTPEGWSPACANQSSLFWKRARLVPFNYYYYYYYYTVGDATYVDRNQLRNRSCGLPMAVGDGEIQWTDESLSYDDRKREMKGRRRAWCGRPFQTRGVALLKARLANTVFKL